MLFSGSLGCSAGPLVSLVNFWFSSIVSLWVNWRRLSGLGGTIGLLNFLLDFRGSGGALGLRGLGCILGGSFGGAPSSSCSEPDTAYICTCMHKYIYTYIHTHIYIHTYNTYTHTYIHIHTHTYIIHTYTHTYIHTYFYVTGFGKIGLNAAS